MTKLLLVCMLIGFIAGFLLGILKPLLTYTYRDEFIYKVCHSSDFWLCYMAHNRWICDNELQRKVCNEIEDAR